MSLPLPRFLAMRKLFDSASRPQCVADLRFNLVFALDGAHHPSIFPAWLQISTYLPVPTIAFLVLPPV